MSTASKEKASGLNLNISYAVLFTTMDFSISRWQVPLLGNVLDVSAGNDTTINNFSCFTFDWEEYVLCSWDYSTKCNSPNVTVKWHFLGSSAWNDCPDLGNKSCKWIIHKDIDGDIKYNVCIKLSQSDKRHCVLVDIQSQVKPSPIRQIEIRVINSTSATLQWPQSRVYYNKSFQVNITRSRKLVSRISFNVTSLPSQSYADGYFVIYSLNHISITINGLSKYTEYGIVINCKPLDNGFWSDGFNTTLTTSKDVPSTPPLIYDGCYSIQTTRSSNERIATIYWMPLNKNNWSGERISYRVKIFPNDSSFQIEETRPFSFSFKTNETAELSVLVWSENEKGLSQQHSKLLVGNKDLIHNSVMVKVDDQRYNISWLPLTHKHDKKYSLFWCEQAFSLVCKTSPQTIEFNTTCPTVYIPDINHSVRYLIGVSYHYLNQTSGFVWSDCVFIGNSLSLELDVIFRPIINHRQLEVYWYFEKCNFPEVKNLVKSYEVTACEDKYCTNFTLDGTETSLRLSLMNICISITPYTVHGKGVPYKRCYQGEETRYRKKRNLTAFYIVSVSVAVLCCPIAVIIICRKYRRWSRGLTDIETTTVVPSTNRAILNGRVRHGDNGFSGVPLISPRSTINVSNIAFNGFTSCNQVKGSPLSESSTIEEDTPETNLSAFTSSGASGETLRSPVTNESSFDISIESYVDAQQIQPSYTSAARHILRTKGNSHVSETILEYSSLKGTHNCSNVTTASPQTNVCDNMSLLPTKKCVFSTLEIDSYVVEDIFLDTNCSDRRRSDASNCLNVHCNSAEELETLNSVEKLQIHGASNYSKAQLKLPDSFAADSDSDHTQETSDCLEECLYSPHTKIDLSVEVRKDAESSNQRKRDILENNKISPSSKTTDFYLHNDSVTESVNLYVQQQATGYIKEPLMSTQPITGNSNYS
ncbi:unnamed protein product [Mytilus coruscus]|uniref:Fibronectin type-III domain-containing protein n=1 Tax=Mytilus coruscus TaxID=42192 RepID=A0A6J8BDQ4_MYTCO|nr:unnamed protein product [Mytilus coruscus]